MQQFDIFDTFNNFSNILVEYYDADTKAYNDVQRNYLRHFLLPASLTVRNTTVKLPFLFPEYILDYSDLFAAHANNISYIFDLAFDSAEKAARRIKSMFSVEYEKIIEDAKIAILNNLCTNAKEIQLTTFVRINDMTLNVDAFKTLLERNINAIAKFNVEYASMHAIKLIEVAITV